MKQQCHRTSLLARYKTILISMPEGRWLFNSTQKLFKAFFGCAYLEQHSRLKRIANSFVFVMLLKEKMRY